MTTPPRYGKMPDVKAVPLIRSRIAYSAGAFAEVALWQVGKPVAGSAHGYKYRLAYVVDGACVLRYDNEAGKGDHRHYVGVETAYAFTTPERLVADFQQDIARWNHENRDT